jgi:isoleucyl-tRNA synthetase
MQNGFNALAASTRINEAKQQLFPANMFLEGFDQHNRWFLSSLVLSMTLTD